MLEERKNKLDEIAEDLAELSSRVALQASVKRTTDRQFEEIRASRKEKRCYAEDDEEPFLPADDQATFERARTIGRIEGRFMKLMENRLFEYDEDELQQHTHEQIYQAIQIIYENLREIRSEFEDL